MMSLPETVPATARIELANRIVEASRLLVSRGMNRGASGNISIRNKMTPVCHGRISHYAQRN